MYSQNIETEDKEARMASIPTTTMRIEPQLKEESSQVLEDLGLTLSGAVTIFLKAVVREQGLPFEVKKETSNGR